VGAVCSSRVTEYLQLLFHSGIHFQFKNERIKMKHYFQHVMFFSMGFFTSFVCANEPLTSEKTVCDLSSYYMGNIYPIPEGKGWKFLDIEGNTVNDAVYDSYLDHSGDYTRDYRYYFAKKDNQWYRVLSNGKSSPIKLPDGYDLIFDMRQGVFVLRSDKPVNHPLRLYNSETDTLFPEEFDTIPVGYHGDNLFPIGKFRKETSNPTNTPLGELLEEGIDMNLFDFIAGKKMFPSDDILLLL
jgi:hypothetical protein